MSGLDLAGFARHVADAHYIWLVPGVAVYFVGVGLVALLLTYEQSLVRQDDLSNVKFAFDLNGYVGILYLVTTGLAVYLG